MEWDDGNSLDRIPDLCVAERTIAIQADANGEVVLQFTELVGPSQAWEGWAGQANFKVDICWSVSKYLWNGDHFGNVNRPEIFSQRVNDIDEIIHRKINSDRHLYHQLLVKQKRNPYSTTKNTTQHIRLYLCLINRQRGIIIQFIVLLQSRQTKIYLCEIDC